MFYLIATILLNTLLSAILKILPRYNINALQSIVVNYWVCVITGSLFIGSFPIAATSVGQPWFPWSLLMGAGFIFVFNLLAYSTKMEGVTTATIANKLSLVIPVVASILLYNDYMSGSKIAGILLAFPAVYLTSSVKENKSDRHQFFWPVLLFITSGLLDTLVKYVQHLALPTAAIQAIYTIHVFAVAGVIGTLLVLVMALLGKTKLEWKNLVAGILIGIPNYFSIYYLIRMLNSNFLQSSAAIPVNNIGILITSTLMAILIFKEKVTVPRIIGLVLAIGAILLISLGDMYGSR